MSQKFTDEIKIVIYFPKNPIRDKPLLKKDVPQYIIDNPKIEYKFVEDLGSITKCFYALQDYPNSNIIFCDDDCIYPPNWLEGLVSNFSGKEVLCYRGRNFFNLARPTYRGTKLIEGSKIKTSTNVHIMTGTWGCIIHKDMLHESFFTDYNKETFFSRVDDIWISGHLWKNKIPIRVIPLKGKIVPTSAHKINSLWESNQHSDRNDKGIQHFKKYLK